MSQTPRLWLLLVHQLPPKPPYFRVKIWRLLQAMSSVAGKASVYGLPSTEQAQEDFQWLAREISAGGGEAMICEAQLIEGLSDDDVQALFETARATDYDTLIKELSALAGELLGDPQSLASVGPDRLAQVARLRKRRTQIAAIDFFGAPGRDVSADLLDRLEARLRLGEIGVAAGEGWEPAHHAFRGRVWVTRRGVKVDRIACAWLIRTFIDPDASFKFVSASGYRPVEGELRFDMFEAEFTHEGDRCSFEVLLERLRLDDPSLRAIGEIIHDIDLKDAKFGREETAGVAHLLEGLCRNSAADMDRIERGSAMLADLLTFLRAPEQH